ncbi:MAG: hypothetical protein P1P89_14270 [Desulfobacterales bacterium]|nr:hypothetical protein [Desulfobacterales bacterium]
MTEPGHAKRSQENELLYAFQSLRIIFYQERKQRRQGEFRHIASLVALKPC